MTEANAAIEKTMKDINGVGGGQGTKGVLAGWAV